MRPKKEPQINFKFYDNDLRRMQKLRTKETWKNGRKMLPTNIVSACLDFFTFFFLAKSASKSEKGAQCSKLENFKWRLRHFK